MSGLLPSSELRAILFNRFRIPVCTRASEQRFGEAPARLTTHGQGLGVDLRALELSTYDRETGLFINEFLLPLGQLCALVDSIDDRFGYDLIPPGCVEPPTYPMVLPQLQYQIVSEYIARLLDSHQQLPAEPAGIKSAMEIE